MDLDLDSAVVPTEDFVQALMDHMLDSFLPLRSSRHETPSLILQESVAQKMHVIVLLYNYYHRRQYPDLEFVDFESFWKLAVIIKPSLLVHSLHVRRCNANDPEAQRTIIEKAIMNACNICTRLGALKDTAITKKWPISKVAVFLFDSVEKRCFLTQGLSVIERGYDICNNRSEEFSKVKRKREAEGLLGVVLNAGEHSLEHLAFSAVKEATDINQEDLTVLESHDVYSLSEEERSTRFYLMKCSKSTTEDVIRVCIEDVIHSLQGPLVKKSFGKFMVGPAAEYLYLLPFADILTDWVSRNGKSCTTLRTEVSDGVYQTEDIPDINANNTLTVTLNQKENTEFAMSNLLNSGHPKCAVGDSSMDDAPSTENKTLDMVPAEEKAMISKESDISTTRRDFTNEVEMVDSEREPCNNRSTDVKVTGENDICTMVPSDQQGTPSTDHPLGLFNSSSQHLETVQDVIRSKGTNLLRPAIRVLLKKRDQLSQQQRHLEDEMARCENSLQTILSGGEENLLSIVERILEACDVTCSRGATETNLERHIRLDETHSPECMETKRLSEAILHLQNAYQVVLELDDICCKNNWSLPQYSLFPSNGGFTANVVLVGTDFQYSAVGDLRVNPHKARESAATNILNKLRSMAASQAH